MRKPANLPKESLSVWLNRNHVGGWVEWLPSWLGGASLNGPTANYSSFPTSFDSLMSKTRPKYFYFYGGICRMADLMGKKQWNVDHLGAKCMLSDFCLDLLLILHYVKSGVLVLLSGCLDLWPKLSRQLKKKPPVEGKRCYFPNGNSLCWKTLTRKIRLKAKETDLITLLFVNSFDWPFPLTEGGLWNENEAKCCETTSLFKLSDI